LKAGLILQFFIQKVFPLHNTIPCYFCNARYRDEKCLLATAINGEVSFAGHNITRNSCAPACQGEKPRQAIVNTCTDFQRGWQVTESFFYWKLRKS